MKILLASLCLFMSFLILTAFPSCTKETVTTIVKTDTIRTVVNDNSTLGLLTNKQWILDSVYNNYTGPGTGTLIYARGSNSNSINYDKVRSVYWRGGGADAYNSAGTYFSYNWHLTNIDSTSLLVSNGITPLFYARILNLTAARLAVYDSTSSALDIQIYKP